MNIQDVYDDIMRTGAQGVYASSEVIEWFRNKFGYLPDADSQLRSFRREYGGISFVLEPRPRRFVNTNGKGLAMVEPYIKVYDEIGLQTRINPYWLNAPIEGITKTTPRSYTEYYVDRLEFDLLNQDPSPTVV